MNPSRRILFYLLAIVIVLFLAWRLFIKAPPKPPVVGGGGKDTTAVASGHVTLVIVAKGKGGAVPDTTFKRGQRDFVQWQNDTDLPFTITFKDDPGTTDDDNCAFEEGWITFDLGPHQLSNAYRIANRAAEHGKKIRYSYYSKTTPLEGPPDGPGMTVEE